VRSCFGKNVEAAAQPTKSSGDRVIEKTRLRTAAELHTAVTENFSSPTLFLSPDHRITGSPDHPIPNSHSPISLFRESPMALQLPDALESRT
jgi:hypothetical protein